MGIEDNVAEHQRAEEVHALACTEGSGDRYWRKLYELVAKHVPPPPKRAKAKLKDVKMTDAEAKRFGLQLIPFGEFMGMRVDDVPMERLVWYGDQRWIDELRRYLKSDRIRGEVEE